MGEVLASRGKPALTKCRLTLLPRRRHSATAGLSARGRSPPCPGRRDRPPGARAKCCCTASRTARSAPASRAASTIRPASLAAPSRPKDGVEVAGQHRLALELDVRRVHRAALDHVEEHLRLEPQRLGPGSATPRSPRDGEHPAFATSLRRVPGPASPTHSVRDRRSRRRPAGPSRGRPPGRRRGPPGSRRRPASWCPGPARRRTPGRARRRGLPSRSAPATPTVDCWTTRCRGPGRPGPRSGRTPRTPRRTAS